MVDVSNRRTLFLLSKLMSVITLGVTSYGLINVDIYRQSVPEAFIPGVISQDIISFVAALGLLLCLRQIRQGQALAWLIWVGLIGYLFYAYALYSFDRVYNPLYLFYVEIIGLSIYSLVIFFSNVSFNRIHQKLGKQAPPRKATAILLLSLVVLFGSLWLSILTPAMRDRLPPDGNTIFVLDLAFFLPLATIEAVFLLNRKPLGDVLAIPILIKAGTLGISVLIGTLIAPWFGQDIELASVGLYAILGLGPLAFVIPFLSSLGDRKLEAV